jgi:hypothetical protein
MKVAVTIVAALLFGLPAVAVGRAQPVGDGARTAPAQSEPRRARPKIRVRPIYPYRHTNLPYPAPYPIEYPGPNYKRDCVARYVEEHRPSGTVVTPRLDCRWVRG